ncbi:zwei Ig domain protein zig-2-like [Gigantopelta aegis]|uniref:zwei Ig domain protein zig-2-like n=1 Tax=Gigantopelta aegis TaxID=1735272 RepID=UPI001B8895DE|nr:zwei Ig domain protein zig-2-like [Gigantopelta aegis]
MMSVFERSFMLIVVLVSCTCISAGFLRSLKHKSIFNKKQNSAASKRSSPSDVGPKLFFKGRPLKETVGVGHLDSLVLECQAGGSPNPTIHWLKDGKPIDQLQQTGADHEDTVGQDGLPLLRLSSTKSRLTINCVTPADEGLYACVAETNYQRISQTTTVKLDDSSYNDLEECVVKKALRGEPAKITMWTSTRMEFQKNNVQIYCRADGIPKPRVRWYDVSGKLIEDGRHYKIVDNGDLIIKNIGWMNMGVYTCVADNANGSDKIETFLYPTFRDDDDEEDSTPV